jgi:hypothetical protein
LAKYVGENSRSNERKEELDGEAINEVMRGV